MLSWLRCCKRNDTYTINALSSKQPDDSVEQIRKREPGQPTERDKRYILPHIVLPTSDKNKNVPATITTEDEQLPKSNGHARQLQNNNSDTIQEDEQPYYSFVDEEPNKENSASVLEEVNVNTRQLQNDNSETIQEGQQPYYSFIAEEPHKEKSAPVVEEVNVHTRQLQNDNSEIIQEGQQPYYSFIAEEPRKEKSAPVVNVHARELQNDNSETIQEDEQPFYSFIAEKPNKEKSAPVVEQVNGHVRQLQNDNSEIIQEEQQPHYSFNDEEPNKEKNAPAVEDVDKTVDSNSPQHDTPILTTTQSIRTPEEEHLNKLQPSEEKTVIVSEVVDFPDNNNTSNEAKENVSISTYDQISQTKQTTPTEIEIDIDVEIEDKHVDEIPGNDDSTTTYEASDIRIEVTPPIEITSEIIDPSEHNPLNVDDVYNKEETVQDEVAQQYEDINNRTYIPSDDVDTVHTERVSANEEVTNSPQIKHATFSTNLVTTVLPVSDSEEDNANNELIDSARTSSSEQLEMVEDESVNTADRRPGYRQAVDIDKDLEISVHPKSEDDKLCIKNAIAANEFLENILKENNLDDIIDAMYPRELADGDVIIEEGEPGNHLYISDYGTFEVYISNKLVNTFSDKKVFGELAVLYNSRRMATIKAASTGKVWVLPRAVYQQSLVKDAVKYLEETKSFLTKVPLVNKLSEDKLNKIAKLLRKELFKTGKVIVQEGDEGDKFYIIRAGTVTVTKEGEGKVAELGRGAFFGERALLNADRRQATVTADGPVECLTLTRSEFAEHFDDKVLEHPTAPEIKIPEFNKVESNGKYSDIDLITLEIVRTLGVGGFGRVELVQHKQDRSLTFALKYLKKVDMVQLEQVEHVYNEKNIQLQCDSTFIACMYKTYQDGKYLYFLMESCLGGDLWTFLQKRRNKCVPNQDARFYAGCVLEAIAYLHERNIIFRDLKPENLLIDAQGYLKLTDFGFAKYLGSDAKTYTFAGTPEYVSPEIVYNKGHDKSVDYWAFGVLIFELLVGKTPFRAGADHMKTYNRILKGINSVQMPPTVSRTANNIIVKLCRAMPNERLGAQKNGIADIRNHKWFHGFEWTKLRNRKMKAPFVPKLSSNTDTRYFESFKPDTDIPATETTEFHEF